MLLQKPKAMSQWHDFYIYMDYFSFIAYFCNDTKNILFLQKGYINEAFYSCTMDVSILYNIFVTIGERIFVVGIWSDSQLY